MLRTVTAWANIGASIISDNILGLIIVTDYSILYPKALCNLFDVKMLYTMDSKIVVRIQGPRL